MSGPLQIYIDMAVKPGQQQVAKELMQRIVAVTKSSNDAECLTYQFCLSDDGMRAAGVEGYANSEAFLRQEQALRDAGLPRQLSQVVTIERLSVIGTPSAAVREALGSWPMVVFYAESLGGFALTRVDA